MALRLSDLNDFIAPSQACVKPVAPSKGSGDKVVRIEVEDDGTMSQVLKDGTRAALERASITLNDCLACSGCITSAESMLVEMQTFRELTAVLDKNRLARAEGLSGQLVVVTLSPQSRASLAVRWGLSATEAMGKITSFLRGIGVDVVLDAALGRALSLLESQAEFLERFRNGGPFPMLASACPGWICYAEKTQGEAFLPYLSATKSAQSVTGTLVKGVLARHRDIPSGSIFHVAVMPCLDKKLEASRAEFTTSGVRDVDCVITTGELQQLIDLHGVNLAGLPISPYDSVTGGLVPADVLLHHGGGGSDGYLEHIFTHAARQLFGVSSPPITYEAKRGEDFQEVVLRGPDGKPLLSFALAYGFRNIQNIVRRIKTGKCAYHFVEVMACPRGCLNGGGQLSSPTHSAEELHGLVRAVYHGPPTSRPESEEAVRLREALPGPAVLRTTYHAVEPADRPVQMQEW